MILSGFVGMRRIRWEISVRRLRSAVPALIEALGDDRPVSRWSLSDAPLRENAMIALTKMGQLPQSAMPVMEEALQDENQYIRSWATIALE